MLQQRAEEKKAEPGTENHEKKVSNLRRCCLSALCRSVSVVLKCLRLSTSQETLVPCDCLIVSGSAIVNEATLTGSGRSGSSCCCLQSLPVMSGESVPQMKDAMGAGTDSDLIVDCFGKHRRGPRLRWWSVLLS